MPHRSAHKRTPAVLFCGLFSIAFFSGLANPVSAQESAVDAILDNQAAAGQDAQTSQRRVNDLDDDISRSIAENRLAMQELNRLKIYNSNLQAIVDDQEREKTSLERQIADFGDVERDVVPLMIELIESLDRFVELDLPFLLAERRDRLARLKAGMDRSDLTVSEKYRLIMEAYQIEASYGRNMEAYVGTLEIDGDVRTVDLLRVGRVLLAYQSPDGASTGYWDHDAGRWHEADNAYRREVADGLRIARRQMAPRLLELPVRAAGAMR